MSWNQIIDFCVSMLLFIWEIEIKNSGKVIFYSLICTLIE